MQEIESDSFDFKILFKKEMTVEEEIIYYAEMMKHAEEIRNEESFYKNKILGEIAISDFETEGAK